MKKTYISPEIKQIAVAQTLMISGSLSSNISNTDVYGDCEGRDGSDAW